MPISTQCSACRKRFKAADQLAGKRVKCPQCGSTITIPQVLPEVALSASSDMPSREPVTSVFDEEDIPLQSMSKPAAQPSRSCPGCGADMPAQAVLCVHCGFDTRSGRKLDLGTVDGSPDFGAPMGKKKRRKRETPQKWAFLYGCAASLGFALVGALMWWLAFYVTGFEFGIIAWALGGMAGGGMAMAYGHEEMLGGLAAAAMAFLGIWAANAMMLGTVMLNPEQFVNAAAEPDMAAVALADDAAFANDPAFAQALVPDGAADADADVPVEVFPEEMPAVEGFVGFAVMALIVIVASFIMCFAGFYKILWLVFALSTAYKLGSGGNWSD